MQKAILKKMHSVFNNPIEYFMDINGMQFKLNDYIGKNIRLEWQKKIICYCGEERKKFIVQDFVITVIGHYHKLHKAFFKPELCTAHLGIEERDLEFEKKLQNCRS